MKSQNPGLKPKQMISALRNQATDQACAPSAKPTGAPCIGALGNNSYYGEGIVDAFAAVR